MANVWFAKNAVVKMDLSTNVALSSDTVLNTAFSSGSAITAAMKDVTIVEPMPDVEKVDLLGTDGEDFQNAEIEEKPSVFAEISGTMLLQGTENIERFFYDTGTSAGGGRKTYRAGKATIRTMAFLLDLDDGTDEVAFAMGTAYPSSKDTKVTGADGHFETTFTIKCLPRHFFGPQFQK